MVYRLQQYATDNLFGSALSETVSTTNTKEKAWASFLLNSLAYPKKCFKVLDENNEEIFTEKDKQSQEYKEQAHCILTNKIHMHYSNNKEPIAVNETGKPITSKFKIYI
jgi:hypothetical protein